MPVPFGEMKVGNTYRVVYKKDGGSVTTGQLTKKYEKDPGGWTEGPAVEIDGGDYDFESFEFEVVPPAPVPAVETYAAGPGRNAVLALRKTRGGRPKANVTTKRAAKKTCSPGYEVYNFRKTRKGVFYDCLPKKRKTRRARK